MMSERTALYRHWDADGKLLYVGISVNAIGRLRQHVVGSHWADGIANVTVEYFDTREAAEAAERAAIMGESPAHNIVGAANDNRAAEQKIRSVKQPRKKKEKPRAPHEMVKSITISAIGGEYGPECMLDGATWFDIEVMLGRHIEYWGYRDEEKGYQFPTDEQVAECICEMSQSGEIIIDDGRAYFPIIKNYVFNPTTSWGEFFPEELSQYDKPLMISQSPNAPWRFRAIEPKITV